MNHIESLEKLYSAVVGDVLDKMGVPGSELELPRKSAHAGTSCLRSHLYGESRYRRRSSRRTLQAGDSGD